jgi:preprotein translocase subunit SecB
MAEQQQPEFAIQKIYVKDLSFESPQSPKVFMDKWEPKVDFELNTESAKLEEDVYDVVLKITVTVNIKDKAVFLVEVQQAGIFAVKNFDEEQLGPLLGSFCPNVLFPYAREVVSDVSVRGGFPQLLLSPVNFDALYQQQQQKKH